jgi:hypothetical protein
MSSLPECERDKTLGRLPLGINPPFVAACDSWHAANYAASDKMRQVGQELSNKMIRWLP